MFGTAAAAGATVASKDFSSPEDAIEYFISCLKNDDMEGALHACAIEEMAAGYDYEAMADRLRVLMPIVQSYMPSEYELYVSYNRYRTAQQITMQTAHLINSFDFPEEYENLLNAMPIAPAEGAAIRDALDALEPDLDGLSIVEIEMHDKHDTEQNREVQKKQAKCYSADDTQFRTVLYEYDGDYYAGGFTLMEYDGRWLISSLSDPLSGIPAYGTAEKLSSKSEFSDIIGK